MFCEQFAFVSEKEKKKKTEGWVYLIEWGEKKKDESPTLWCFPRVLCGSQPMFQAASLLNVSVYGTWAKAN